MSATGWAAKLIPWVVLLCLAPAAGAATVDFTLPGLDGVTHKLSDYRGKWVVVNYWATWCPPCREEIPELERFHQENAGKAVVLGINFEQISTARLKRFVEAHRIRYPVLHMEPEPRTSLGPVWGLPTTYIVDPTGNVVGHHTGPLTAQILTEFIQKMERKDSRERQAGHQGLTRQAAAAK